MEGTTDACSVSIVSDHCLVQAYFQFTLAELVTFRVESTNKD